MIMAVGREVVDAKGYNSDVSVGSCGSERSVHVCLFVHVPRLMAASRLVLRCGCGDERAPLFLTVSFMSLLSNRLSLASLCSRGTTEPTPVAD